MVAVNPALEENMSLSQQSIAQPTILEAVRVLVVDDHPLVRHGLMTLIQAEPSFEVCAEASDEDSALQAVKTSRPDLAIIGLSHRKSTSLELVRRIHMIAPEVRVLVSSPHESSLYAERALKAGAMAYVCKSESIERTLEALHRVRRGKIYLSERLSDRLLHRLAEGTEEEEESPFTLLSDRELQIFERYGRGMTTFEIARQLHLSTKTVDTHRQQIKRKLQLGSTNEIVLAGAQFLWQGG